MSNDFNFFKVLEKDNKELIHSAFIAYLLDSDENLQHLLFKLPNIEFCKPHLERCYNVSVSKSSKKKLRVRIDIELISNDKKHIIVIENKFKSFPYKRQLDDYSKIYKKLYGENKSIYKYLFCFDKSLIDFETDWTIFDYNDLLLFIEQNFKLDCSDDGSIFVKHYHCLLRDYLAEYKFYIKDSRKLFKKNLTNNEKFWLKLINSNLHLKFMTFLNCNTDFSVNPGNTNIPVLNIIPHDWMINGNELLIQFQGNDLKFYIHSGDKELIAKIVKLAKENIMNDKIEFKKIDNRNAKSSFIFKTKISENIFPGRELDIDMLFAILQKFYYDIDSKIIKNYSQSG